MRKRACSSLLLQKVVQAAAKRTIAHRTAHCRQRSFLLRPLLALLGCAFVQTEGVRGRAIAKRDLGACRRDESAHSRPHGMVRVAAVPSCSLVGWLGGTCFSSMNVPDEEPRSCESRGRGGLGSAAGGADRSLACSCLDEGVLLGVQQRRVLARHRLVAHVHVAQRRLGRPTQGWVVTCCSLNAGAGQAARTVRPKTRHGDVTASSSS